jgi:hypothetical protein
MDGRQPANNFTIVTAARKTSSGSQRGASDGVNRAAGANTDPIVMSFAFFVQTQHSPTVKTLSSQIFEKMVFRMRLKSKINGGILIVRHLLSSPLKVFCLGSADASNIRSSCFYFTSLNIGGQTS